MSQPAWINERASHLAQIRATSWTDSQKPEFGALLIEALKHSTYEDMANAFGCSVSTINRRIAQARRLQQVGSNDNVTAEEAQVEKSLLEILLDSGKIAQADIDALATPAPTPIAAPVPCGHVTHAEAATEIHRLVHASGGNLSQAKIGRIWGYSPAWCGQVLARG